MLRALAQITGGGGGSGTVTTVTSSDGSLTVTNPTTTPDIILNVGHANTWSAVQTFTNPIVGTQSQSDNSTKAASTSYVMTAVNNAISGVNPAVAVQVATTANLSGYTYNNGASGIGATLTQNSAAIVIIDGYTLLLNDRVLFKNQSTAANNGVYVITTLGTGLIPAVFTRATDYNQPSDINNTGAIPVVNGTVNSTTSWLLTSTVNTVGTDALTYVQFSINPTTILSNTLSSANIFVGNASNIATGVSLSGDGALNNAGSLTISKIGGKSVSLAAAFTTAGANSLTLTTTGTTNVTLPTSGTLLSTATAVTVGQGGTGATNAQVATQNLGTWWIAGQSGASASHTGDTTETTLATITIPANSLGNNGSIRITTFWTYTSSANNKNFKIRYSGASGTQYLQLSATATSTLQTQQTITNANATNSQIGWASNGLNPFTTSSSATITSAVDTTASTTVVISCLLSNTGETITLNRYLVEVSFGA
jgi:hypothetical protein